MQEISVKLKSCQSERIKRVEEKAARRKEADLEGREKEIEDLRKRQKQMTSEQAIRNIADEIRNGEEALKRCDELLRENVSKIDGQIEAIDKEVSDLERNRNDLLHDMWESFINDLVKICSDLTDSCGHALREVTSFVSTKEEYSADEDTAALQRVSLDNARRIYKIEDETSVKDLLSRCEKLQSDKNEILEKISAFIIKMETYLGQGSVLFILHRLLRFGVCAISGLQSCLENALCLAETGIISADKKIMNEFMRSQKELSPLISKVLGSGAYDTCQDLNDDEVQTLLKHFHRLGDLKEQLSGRNDLIVIQMSHSQQFVASCLVFSLGRKEALQRKLGPSIVLSILKIADITSVPAGNTSLRALLRRLAAEQRSLVGISDDQRLTNNFSTLRGVSTYALYFQAHSVSNIIQATKQPHSSSVESDLTNYRNKVSRDSINLSVSVSSMNDHLRQLISAFRDSAAELSDEECSSLEAFVNSLSRLTSIGFCVKDDHRQGSLLSLLQDKIHDYLKSCSDSSHGAYGMLESACDLQSMFSRRAGLQYHLQDIVELAETTEATLCQIHLAIEFSKNVSSLLANEDSGGRLLFSQLRNRHSGENEKITAPSLLAQYAYNTIKEIIDLAVKGFEMRHLYKSVNERFEKTITSTEQALSKMISFLQRPESEIQESLDSSSCSDWPEIVAIESASHMMKWGALFGALREMSEMRNQLQLSLNKSCDLLQSCKQFLMDWKDSKERLLEIRENIYEEINSSNTKRIEEVRKSILARNVKKRREHQQKLKDYEKNKSEAQSLIREAFDELVLGFGISRKHGPSKGISDKKRHEIKCRVLEDVSKLRNLKLDEHASPSVDDYFYRTSLTISNLSVTLSPSLRGQLAKTSEGKVYFEAKICVSVQIGSDEKDPERKETMRCTRFLLKKPQTVSIFKSVQLRTSETAKYMTLKFTVTVKDRELSCEKVIPLNELTSGPQTMKGNIPRGAADSYVEFKFQYREQFLPELQKCSEFCSAEIEREAPLNDADHFSKCEEYMRKFDRMARSVEKGPPTEPAEEDNLPEHKFKAWKETLDPSQGGMALYDLMLPEVSEKWQDSVDALKSQIVHFSDRLNQIHDCFSDEDPSDAEATAQFDAVLSFAKSVSALYSSAETRVMEIRSIRDGFLKEWKAFLEKKICVEKDQDMMQASSTSYKELKPLDSVYLPGQGAAARKYWELLKQLVMQHEIALNHLRNIMKQLCNLLGATVSLPFQFSIENVEKVKSTLPRVFHSHVQTVLSYLMQVQAREKSLASEIDSLDKERFKSISKMSFEKFDPPRSKTASTEVYMDEDKMAFILDEIEIDLGVFVKGWPVKNDVYFRVTSLLDFPCDFHLKFVGQKDAMVAVMPCETGVLQENGRSSFSFLPELDRCDLEKGQRKDFQQKFELTVTDAKDHSCRVSLVIFFSVEFFDKSTLFPELLLKESDNGDYSLLDLGILPTTETVKKEIEIKNSLSIPLRLKMPSSKKRIEFSKSEVNLSPGQSVRETLTLKTQSFEKDRHPVFHRHSFHLCSGVSHDLAISYRSCKPMVKIISDGNNYVTVHLIKKNLRMNPEREKNDESIKIRNTGAIPVFLRIKAKRPNDFVKIDLTDQELTPSAELKVPIRLLPNDGGDFPASVEFSVQTAHGSYVNNLKSFNIRVNVQSQWPKLEISSDEFTVTPDEAKEGLQRTILLENTGSVAVHVKRIWTEQRNELEIVDKELPLVVRPRSQKQLTVCLRPPLIPSFDAVLQIESDCKEKLKKHTIRCRQLISQLELSTDVFNAGTLFLNHKETEFTLSMKNAGNFDVMLEVERSLKTVVVADLEYPKFPKLKIFKESKSEKSELFFLKPNEERQLRVIVRMNEKMKVKTDSLLSFQTCLIFQACGESLTFQPKKIIIFGCVQQVDAEKVSGDVRENKLGASCVSFWKRKISLRVIREILQVVGKPPNEPLMTFLMPFVNAALAFGKDDDVKILMQCIGLGSINRDQCCEVFKTYLRRAPTEEEVMWILSSSDKKETSKMVVDLSDELFSLNGDPNLFSILLRNSFHEEERKEESCRKAEKMLDSTLDNAARLCTFVLERQEVGKEVVRRIQAIFEALKKSIASSLDPHLSSICALAEALKSDYFGGNLAKKAACILDSVMDVDLSNRCESAELVRILVENEVADPGALNAVVELFSGMHDSSLCVDTIFNFAKCCRDADVLLQHLTKALQSCLTSGTSDMKDAIGFLEDFCDSVTQGTHRHTYFDHAAAVTARMAEKMGLSDHVQTAETVLRKLNDMVTGTDFSALHVLEFVSKLLEDAGYAHDNLTALEIAGKVEKLSTKVGSMEMKALIQTAQELLGKEVEVSKIEQIASQIENAANEFENESELTLFSAVQVAAKVTGIPLPEDVTQLCRVFTDVEEGIVAKGFESLPTILSALKTVMKEEPHGAIEALSDMCTELIGGCEWSANEIFEAAQNVLQRLGNNDVVSKMPTLKTFFCLFESSKSASVFDINHELQKLVDFPKVIIDGCELIEALMMLCESSLKRGQVKKRVIREEALEILKKRKTLKDTRQCKPLLSAIARMTKSSLKEGFIDTKEFLLTLKCAWKTSSLCEEMQTSITLLEKALNFPEEQRAKTDIEERMIAAKEFLSKNGASHEVMKAVVVGRLLDRMAKEVMRHGEVRSSDLFNCVLEIVEVLGASQKIEERLDIAKNHRVADDFLQNGSDTHTAADVLCTILRLNSASTDHICVVKVAKHALQLARNKFICASMDKKDILFGALNILPDVGATKDVKAVVDVAVRLCDIGNEIETKEILVSNHLKAVLQVCEFFNCSEEEKEMVQVSEAVWTYFVDSKNNGVTAANLHACADVVLPLLSPETHAVSKISREVWFLREKVAAERIVFQSWLFDTARKITETFVGTSEETLILCRDVGLLGLVKTFEERNDTDVKSVLNLITEIMIDYGISPQTVAKINEASDLYLAVKNVHSLVKDLKTGASVTAVNAVVRLLETISGLETDPEVAVKLETVLLAVELMIEPDPVPFTVAANSLIFVALHGGLSLFRHTRNFGGGRSNMTAGKLRKGEPAIGEEMRVPSLSEFDGNDDSDGVRRQVPRGEKTSNEERNSCTANEVANSSAAEKVNISEATSETSKEEHENEVNMQKSLSLDKVQLLVDKVTEKTSGVVSLLDIEFSFRVKELKERPLDLDDLLFFASKASDTTEDFQFCLQTMSRLSSVQHLTDLFTEEPDTLTDIRTNCFQMHSILSLIIKHVDEMAQVSDCSEKYHHFNRTFTYCLRRIVERLKSILRILFEAGGEEETFRVALEEIQIIHKTEASDYSANDMRREVNPLEERNIEISDSTEVLSIADFDIRKILDEKDEERDVQQIPESYGRAISSKPLSGFVTEFQALSPRENDAKTAQTISDLKSKMKPKEDLPKFQKLDQQTVPQANSTLVVVPGDLLGDDSTFAKNSAGTVSISSKMKGDIDLLQMMRRHVQRKSKDSDSVAQATNNPENLPEVDQTDLKYTTLARIMKIHQMQAIEVLKTSMNVEDFKFLFLVDNSGSMSGENIVMALNCLVVFLEAMKFMECATAVVRFGGETQILKEFEWDMSNKRGQLILEKFDCSEKTLPLNALESVVKTPSLYGKSPEEKERRFIIFLTDGILTQGTKEQYDKVLKKAHAELLVLVINFRKDAELQELTKTEAEKILSDIAPYSWIDIDLIKPFSDHITEIAEKLAKRIKSSTANDNCDESEQETLSTFDLVSLNSAQRNLVLPRETEWGNKVYAADINNFEEDGFIADSFTEELTEYLRQKVESVENSKKNEETSEVSDSISQLSKVVDDREEELSEYAADLYSVLDEVVLPNNRPTRAMQDYHGPTFSLRGFIRFICTDGQYRKIYENVIGHPKKDYQVCVVLDTSVSMGDMTGAGATEAFIGLAAALSNCSVRFALLTADVTTRVVKLLDEEWGPMSKARAAAAIRFDGRKSNIADSVMYATELAQRGASSQTVKIVLVLTDGYDSSPRRLKKSLAYANSQNVTVVGIGIGYFTDGVFDCFPHYVVVNDPKLLPDGLRQFFSGDGNSDMPSNVAVKQLMKEREKLMKKMEKGEVLDPNDPWLRDMVRVYEKETETAAEQLKCASVPLTVRSGGSLSIDICFVMDTTGSMWSHLEGAKQYVKTLATDIEKHVESFGKSSDLRMAFVTYKHFGNPGHLDNQPFTGNIDALRAKVESMHSSGGGGDEDTFGGVMTAMNFEWKGTSKFLVLVGDMPDHILNCSGCKRCNDDRQKRSGGILDLIRRMVQEKIRLFFVRITPHTEKDEVRYEKEYRVGGFSEGFVVLDITEPGAADKLKSMIQSEIINAIIVDFL